MSDYHVLNAVELEDAVRVVFHIPVPDANNSASVNWRTALRQYIPMAAEDSLVPNHSTDFATENADLVAGIIHEYAENVKFAADASNAQKQTTIENRYTQLLSSETARLQKILKFWGLNNDVV